MASDADCVALLAERIQRLHTFFGRSVVVGINGAPGSGKTTLARSLRNRLQQESELSSVCVSIDDLYLSKRARQELARKQHPLLLTRGVPGTHDVDLGIDVLRALTKPAAASVVTLPGFDKAHDDRIEVSRLRTVETPVDVVLFEGWCVGARPQQDEDLTDPINELEAEQDPDGTWRTYVNTKLKDEYARLFECIDALVMLRVPSFGKVLEWRTLQEQELRECVRTQAADEVPAAGMRSEELRRFVMYFERLTRHMLEDVPNYADTVIDIDESHRMVAAINSDWPFESAVP
jgi:D-glycerate 3-kinase